MHLKWSKFIESLILLVLFNWNSWACYPRHWKFSLIEKRISHCVLLYWLCTYGSFIYCRGCTCFKYWIFKFLISKFCRCSAPSFFIHVNLTFEIFIFLISKIFLQSNLCVSSISISWKWSFEKIILSYRHYFFIFWVLVLWILNQYIFLL